MMNALPITKIQEQNSNAFPQNKYKLQKYMWERKRIEFVYLENIGQKKSFWKLCFDGVLYKQLTTIIVDDAQKSLVS